MESDVPVGKDGVPLHTNRVFIGKLFGVSKEDLAQVLCQLSPLTDFIMKDNFAFAEFATDEDAKTAIMELDGRLIRGQRICAELAKHKCPDQSYFALHPRLYISRIPEGVTRKDFFDLFSKFGEVVDAIIKEDYGFIEFANPEDARMAMFELNGSFWNNTKLYIEEARPKEYEDHSLTTPRLHVAGVPQIAKKHDLYLMFGKYGEIADILLKEDFAFVEFKQMSSAFKAMVELNGMKLLGSRVNIEEAKPRDDSINQFQILNPFAPKSNRTLSLANPQIVNQPKIPPATDGTLSEEIKQTKRRSPRRSVSRSRSRDKKREYQQFLMIVNLKQEFQKSHILIAQFTYIVILIMEFFCTKIVQNQQQQLQKQTKAIAFGDDSLNDSLL